MKRKAPTKRKAVEAPAKLGLKTPTGRIRKSLAPQYSITRAEPVDPHAKALPPKAIRAIEFGRLLRAAMLIKGIKQIQLSELSKIGRDSISGYCNGHNIPGDERLEAIARVLEVKPTDLLPTYGTDLKEFERNATFTMRRDPNGKDTWLTINRAIPNELASRLMDLFNQADADMEKRNHKKSKN